jgi:hypothetical protein
LDSATFLAQVVTTYNTSLAPPHYKTAAQQQSEMNSFFFKKKKKIGQELPPTRRAEVLTMANIT